jgi:geranylgeranyl pyrophosphate synthase
MTQIGFHAVRGKETQDNLLRLELASLIIEGLHAGSMIIDDIQDQSEERRGQASLYKTYGIPVALNVGNWLYFQALEQIQKLNLGPKQELELSRYINKILLRAHFGQAVDLGTPVTSLPQDLVQAACMTSMELKTGALMSLGYNVGSFITQPDEGFNPQGSLFAKKFGIALQMFDDVGNFIAPPPKGMEDMRNRRPSWIWAVASLSCGSEDYQNFIQSIEALPNQTPLNHWSDKNLIVSKAKMLASDYLWNLFKEQTFPESLQIRLKRLFTQLENSYV